MTGFDHPWLLLPLKRGALLSLFVVGLCASSLWWEHAAAAVSGDPAAGSPDANATAAPEAATPLPRIVLRLWFLAPQIIPSAAR